MITLYDLAGADGRRFSPYCWRIRMALAHKGLACQTRATRFCDIPSIADGKQKTVPVVDADGQIVGDSWQIAKYLEEAYPGGPALFGGPAVIPLTAFVQSWVFNVLHRGILSLIVLDIYEQLDAADRKYFRETRERRFGARLEEVQAGRENRVSEFRKTLEPLRQLLQTQPWLSGDSPLYADYVVFGAFQWARVISSFALLTEDDAVSRWFSRGLALFDGLGLKAAPFNKAVPFN
jgi:glutathione S-transferase